MVKTEAPYAVKDGRKLSLMCRQLFGEERELRVLSSAAGYYLGTLDDYGLPNSRDSQYYATREAAQAALDTGSFTPRLHP